MLKFGPRKTNCWIGKRIHFLLEHVRIFPETQGSLDKRLGYFGGKSTMGAVSVTCLLFICVYVHFNRCGGAHAHVGDRSASRIVPKELSTIFFKM